MRQQNALREVIYEERKTGKHGALPGRIHSYGMFWEVTVTLARWQTCGSGDYHMLYALSLVWIDRRDPNAEEQRERYWLNHYDDAPAIREAMKMFDARVAALNEGLPGNGTAISTGESRVTLGGTAWSESD